MKDTSSVIFYILLVFSASIFAYLSEVNLKEKLFSRKNLNITSDRNNKYYNKYFMIISFICLTLPVAFRHYVGADYTSYVEIYNGIAKYGPFHIYSQYEIGFKILNYLCYIIFHDYHFVFIIVAFVSNFLIYKGILYERKKINVGVAVFAYGFTLYFLGYVIIRNILGIAIVFYGFKYLFKNQRKKFFIAVTAACMFHYSLAIFYIIGILLMDRFKKYGRKALIIFTFIIIFIKVFPYPSTFVLKGLAVVFPRIWYYYSGFINSQFHISLYMFVYILPIVPIMLYYKKLLQNNPNTYYYFNFYVISIILLLLSSFNPVIVRFAYALWPALIILLAALVKQFDESKIYKYIILFIIVYGTGLMLKFVTIQSYYLLPYKTMFFIH